MKSFFKQREEDERNAKDQLAQRATERIGRRLLDVISGAIREFAEDDLHPATGMSALASAQVSALANTIASTGVSFKMTDEQLLDYTGTIVRALEDKISAVLASGQYRDAMRVRAVAEGIANSGDKSPEEVTEALREAFGDDRVYHFKLGDDSDELGDDLTTRQ